MGRLEEQSDSRADGLRANDSSTFLMEVAISGKVTIKTSPVEEYVKAIAVENCMFHMGDSQKGKQGVTWEKSTFIETPTNQNLLDCEDAD